MENSHLIALPGSEDLHVFVRGYELSRPTAAGIAWTLEDIALREGWPTGKSLGSELELMSRFSVSRDSLREAIRLVEARGSMRMQRGCQGGLHVTDPTFEHTALAFATYLRASGYTNTQLSRTASVAGALFAELLPDTFVVLLCKRTFQLFTANTVVDSSGSPRSRAIAMQLIQRSLAQETKAMLGSQATLCAEFNCCASTLRQALRILDDLCMLRVRRGRGGGYLLKRPAPIGMIRQLFAALASRHQSTTDVVPVMWSLNLINLRLATRRLGELDEPTRAGQLDALEKIFDDSREPQRWAKLQHALGSIAGDTLINTLQSALVAYHARIDPSPSLDRKLSNEIRLLEREIIRAIRSGASDEAESNHRKAQSRIASQLPEPTTLRT